MRFINSGYIYYAIAVVLGLGLFYLWAFKARRQEQERFAEKGLLKELTASVSPKKRIFKISLIFLGAGFCFFALLRPQWGFRWEEVKRKGLDIMIAIDTSKSMLAEDIRPNRLARSKLAVSDFIKNLKGDRIGLIAFAGNAFVQCPLTLDYNGFLLSFESVDTDTIPRGGTSISRAIREALTSYEGGQKKYKVLIIITDGEDHEGDPLKAAEEAAKEGITIFCIGIGTKEGELVPVIDEGTGKKAFLKDRQGNAIKSRLDETTLQKIALKTSGAYVRSTSAEFGLDLIYRQRLSKMEKRELLGKMNKHYEERFQIFLIAAGLLFLAELFINDRRQDRR